MCYFRVWDGLRRVARTTSKDFLPWTPATLMRQVHDDGVRLHSDRAGAEVFANDGVCYTPLLKFEVREPVSFL